MKEIIMKHFALALSVLAVLSLSACANGSGWTPMSDGRTAGQSVVDNSTGSKADGAFSRSLRK